MNIFNNVAILVLVPLFEQILYPYLRSKNIELSMLQKIGMGFIIAMLAMLAAAIVEVCRVEYSPPDGDYYDVDARNNISPCRYVNLIRLVKLRIL